MNNKLTKTENLISFSEEQKALLKRTIADGATDDEFKLFLYQAERTGLDPFARQIYFIKRKAKVKQPDGSWKTEGKVTIQTSIDGLRLIAQRSGDYGGQDAPEWFKTKDNELYAKVKIYKFRGNLRYLAAEGVAYWSEYCPMYNGEPSKMWKEKPRTMIAKVAEALALRKAFPQELSGLYTTEEMDQAGEEAPKEPEVLKPAQVEPVEAVEEKDTHEIFETEPSELCLYDGCTKGPGGGRAKKDKNELFCSPECREDYKKEMENDA